MITRREAGPVAWWPLKCCILSVKAKGNDQARVQSGQMVLMIVRWETGPVASWPKTLK